MATSGTRPQARRRSRRALAIACMCVAALALLVSPTPAEAATTKMVPNAIKGGGSAAAWWWSSNSAFCISSNLNVAPTMLAEDIATPNDALCNGSGNAHFLFLGGLGNTDDFELSDSPGDVDTATSITMRVRTRGSTGGVGRIRLRLADTTLVGTMNMSAAGSFTSNTGTPIAGSWSKADLDGMYVQIQDTCACSSAVSTVNIDVTYTPVVNNAPSPPTLGTPVSGRTTSYSQPGFTANFNDADPGATGSVEFEVCTVAMAAGQTCAGAGGSVLASGSSLSGNADGELGVWQPGAALADGTVHWHARSVDQGALTSAWTASRSLVIDSGMAVTSATLVPSGIRASGEDWEQEKLDLFCAGSGGNFSITIDEDIDTPNDTACIPGSQHSDSLRYFGGTGPSSNNFQDAPPDLTTIDDIHFRIRIQSTAVIQRLVLHKADGTPLAIAAGTNATFQTYGFRLAGANLSAADVDGLYVEYEYAGSGTVRISAVNLDLSYQPVTIPTLSYFTGFEHGTLDSTGGGIVDAVTGSPQATTAAPRAGDRSMEVDTLAAATPEYAVRNLTSASTNAVVRVAVRIDADDNSDTATLVHLRSANDNNAQLRYTASNNTLSYRVHGGSAQSSAPLTLGQWYVVGLTVDTTADPWVGSWEIDGVAQTGVSDVVPGADVNDTWTSLEFGSRDSGGDNIHVFLDDLAISETAADYPISDGHTRAIRPMAAGTHVSPGKFADDDTSAIDATSYARVDDPRLSSSTDWVTQTTSGTSDWLEWEFENSPESGTVHAVRGIAAVAAAGTAANASTVKAVRAGDTDGAAPVVFAGDASATSNQYFGSMIAAPAAGWDATELSALRMRTGYWDGTGATPRWHGGVFEVEFEGPPPAVPAPDTAYFDDADASAGTSNNPAITNDDHHYSWVNNAGEDVDRQRVQVVNTPLDAAVALWRMDGDWTDASGNGRDLTPGPGAAAPTFAAAQSGYGQSANYQLADGDQLTRAWESAFDLDTFTVDAWFNTTVPVSGNHSYIVAKRPDHSFSGTNTNYLIRLNRLTERIEADYSVGGVDQPALQSPAGVDMSDGAWHHVAFVINSVPATDTAELYIDGELVDSDTFVGNVDNPAEPVTVGYVNDGSPERHWDGMIDDVRIADSAIGPDEVLSIYQDGASHGTILWDSDTSDTGVALGSTCADGNRCADIAYGATGAPTELIFGDARYYARAKFRTTAAGSDTWSDWSSWDWFETLDTTSVNTAGCQTGDPGVTDFGTVLVGIPAVTPDDCSITFGSNGASTQLRMYQADGRGVSAYAAADGQLDPDFDGLSGTGDGVVEFDIGGVADQAEVIVADSQDRLLVGGSLTNGDLEAYLMRLLPDGTTDPSFNGGAPIIVDASGGGNDWIREITVDLEDRVLAMGQSGGNIAIYRFLDDGSPDTSWGPGGLRTYDPVTQLDEPGYIAVRPDGDMIVVSRYNTDDLVVMQLNPDGSLDADFNGGTVRTLSVNNSGASRPDAVLREDGTLVIVAREDVAGAGRLHLFALLPDGSDDPAFAGGGDTVLNITGSSQQAFEIHTDSQGRLILGGEFTETPANIGVARLTANGAIDNTFGASNGWASLDIGGLDQVGRTMRVLPDDRIVVAGRHNNGVDDEWLIARFTPDGDLDTSFNDTGYLRLDLTPGEDRIPQNHQLTLLSDGGMALSGSGTNATMDSIVVQMQGAATVPDWNLGVNDWSVGGGMFGACLRTVATGATDDTDTWSVDPGNDCAATNADAWNAIPADASDPASKVAETTGPGVAGATANIRFGTRPVVTAPSGLTFIAPTIVEAVSPNL